MSRWDPRARGVARPSAGPGRVPAFRRSVRWLPAVAWAVLIFLLSAQPGLRVSDDDAVDGPVRHLAHVGAYAVLTILVLNGLDALRTPPGRRAALAALAIAVGYGVTDEAHQAFVPHRTAQLVDVGYDAAGALLGLAAAVLLARLSAARRARAPTAPP